MKVTHDRRRITVEVTPDGEGLVSHAGSALLSRVADKTGLTRALSLRLGDLKSRRSGHDLGRVVRDLAVMLADGGDCLADLGALQDQGLLFGQVASTSTAFRVIDRIASDPDGLQRLRAAHGVARSRAWKLTGAPARVDIDSGRDADHEPFGEGGRGRHVQGRLRLSPAAGLLRSDRRGAWRRAAPGECRGEHRRRPDQGRRAGLGADSRRAHPGHRDLAAGRFGGRQPRAVGLVP